MGIGHDFQPELSNIGDMIRLYELGDYNEMEVSNQGGQTKINWQLTLITFSVALYNIS